VPGKKVAGKSCATELGGKFLQRNPERLTTAIALLSCYCVPSDEPVNGLLTYSMHEKLTHEIKLFAKSMSAMEDFNLCQNRRELHVVIPTPGL
jgi:hypothetical protein